jgi:non-heme chloroperoxidase
MRSIATSDGARIAYKDWGHGPVVLLSHGWADNADSWDQVALALAERGMRVIAHDRRGHGRSSQEWEGNHLDRYADDLRELLIALRLDDVALVGFGGGGSEIGRYVGRHGTTGVRGVVLVSAPLPYLLRDETNPDGIPLAFFDRLRLGWLRDRSRFSLRLADGRMFEPAPQPVSEGVRRAFSARAMQSGHHNAHASIGAFAESDLRSDLTRLDVPTLVVHGAEDRLVPSALGAEATARIVTHAEVKVYPGAPHALPVTHTRQLLDDLVAFLEAL